MPRLPASATPSLCSATALWNTDTFWVNLGRRKPNGWLGESWHWSQQVVKRTAKMEIESKEQQRKMEKKYITTCSRKEFYNMAMNSEVYLDSITNSAHQRYELHIKSAGNWMQWGVFPSRVIQNPPQPPAKGSLGRTQMVTNSRLPLMSSVSLWDTAPSPIWHRTKINNTP